MSEERKERCETCRFWVGYDFDDTYQPPECPRNNVGICRRFPPVQYGDDAFSVDDYTFPLTQFDDWCGEWQATRPPIPERIDIRPLSVRTRKVLSRFFDGHIANSELTREQVNQMTENGLMETVGCGNSVVSEIREFLAAMGLSLPKGSD